MKESLSYIIDKNKDFIPFIFIFNSVFLPLSQPNLLASQQGNDTSLQVGDPKMILQGGKIGIVSGDDRSRRSVVWFGSPGDSAREEHFKDLQKISHFASWYWTIL